MRCFCLVLLSLLTTPLRSQENADFLRLRPVNPRENRLFSWVHRGDLFRISFGPLSAGGYLYRTPDKQQISVVSNHLADAAQMMQTEMSSLKESEQFIQSDLSFVLCSFFGPIYSHMVTEPYVRNREELKTLPARSWNGATPDDLSKANEILKNYISSGRGIITSKTWTLMFHIALKDGSVEKWSFAGSVYPFAIDSFDKNKAEKEATIPPIPEIDF